MKETANTIGYPVKNRLSTLVDQHFVLRHFNKSLRHFNKLTFFQKFHDFILLKILKKT